jgi:hypothetical protein
MSDITEAKPGGWIIQLTCCGRDAGTWAMPAWQQADEFRESARINAHARQVGAR